MKTLLVIDDEATTHRRLHQLSEERPSFRFISAATGSEGEKLALEQEPELILLNAQLQHEEWRDVLRTLHDEVPHTPIVLTSSRKSTSEIIEAFRAGACDYVTKPLDPTELLETIDRALESVRVRGERDRLARQLIETTETLRRQQQELNAVHVIGRLTTSLLDLDTVLDRFTEIALHMTEAEQSMLFLREEDEDELQLRAGKNLDQELVEGTKLPLDRTAAGRAIRTARPVLVTGEEARIAPGCACEALLHVPLQAPDRVIGLLTLSSHEHEDVFSERNIFLLSTLVDYAAIAIQNARLFERTVESKSLMDNVFSSVTSGVLTLDRDDQITLINGAARSILQASGAAVGEPLVDAHPSLARKIRPLIEATRKQDEPTGPLEIDLLLPSGEVVNLRMTLSPLRSGTGSTEGVAIVIEDLTRQRKLESRFRLFQRYLSPTVIDRLPDDPKELRLGGVRREIACLFADLRGFVDFSVRHSPEKLMETLNKYLGVGAEAVLAEEGTLDKFVGDAVVAFFNAPLTQDNYSLRAVRAAARITEATLHLHARLAPEHRIEYGIGISVGEAIVGNIGTSQRFDYTAIGPSVNMANRLQAAAKPGQVLITPQVYERTRDHITARPLVLAEVTGPEGPIHAYELLSLS